MGMGAGLLALGMALYTLGSRVVPAAELTLLSMAEVLLAPVWVWLVLGETAAGSTLAGGALVLAAIAGNALSGMRRKPLAPPVT
jgi:drug/metabolite transporter (DMT)-like permease